MPWNEVTVKEQRENFIRDYRHQYYSVSELAERFGISRNTGYKWIGRWEQGGRSGLQERSKRPRSHDREGLMRFRAVCMVAQPQSTRPQLPIVAQDRQDQHVGTDRSRRATTRSPTLPPCLRLTPDSRK